MVIAPSTNIKLLECPLTRDQRHQLTWSSIQAQFEYFNSLPQLSIDDNTYQRTQEGAYIRIPDIYENISKYNYCMYQNEAWGNKWFYAFITKIEFVNTKMSQVYIETDVMQTWYDEMTLKPMFIEREHVNDDTVGAHTFPENLELGDYITQNLIKVDDLTDLAFILCASTFPGSEGDLGDVTRLGDMLYAGITFCFTEAILLSAQIKKYQDQSQTDAITNIYAVPKVFVPEQFWNKQITGIDVQVISKNISKPSTLQSYIPVNKKLLTFPYCFLTLSNNRGNSNNYRYEDFISIDEFPNQCIFNIAGLPVVGGQCKCSPTNYKVPTDNENVDEGVVGGNYPILNWQVDNYGIWLRGNIVNTASGITSDIIQILPGAAMLAAGIYSGNGLIGASGVASLANSLTDISRQVGQVNQQSLVPNSSRGNINNGDIITADHTNTFYFYQKCIKAEYAKIIDNYFSMFGYKVNEIKVPNINTRQNWNYIKTIGANIIGPIPQEDIEKIKKIFDNGITFWHSPTAYLNYTLPNPII